MRCLPFSPVRAKNAVLQREKAVKYFFWTSVNLKMETGHIRDGKTISRERKADEKSLWNRRKG
jgi:GH43 family beta-xylosidase